MNKNNLLFILPAVIILIVLGIYYYNYSKPSSKNDNSSKAGEAAVLGTNTGTSVSNDEPAITDSNQYFYQVSDVRVPINKKIEELLPKLQYTTLFDKDQMISGAEEIKKMLNDGINTFNGLKLSSTLQAVNKKEVESMQYLIEGMDAIIALENTDDQKEKQKQNELLNWKINESNRVLNEIQKDSSGSSGSSNSGSSGSSGSGTLNVTDVLQ